jgi:DNA (cytosine-5)-methyltransferase 3A
MNVLSLFDGISCGQIALERAGIKVDDYFASEIDKYAMKVTQKNYPNTIQLGDVKEIDVSKLPKIDLLIGGSPCTNFSFIGKKNGMSTIDKLDIISLEQYLKLKSDNFIFDGYSYLFWEYIRILKEAQPKYFLLENVKMEEKWKNIISSVIGTKPILINSSLVSSQSRNRLYWTNIPNITIPIKKDININEELAEYPIWKPSTIFVKNKQKFIKFTNKMSCLTTYCGNPNGIGRPFWAKKEEGISKPFDYSKVKRISTMQAEILQTLPLNYTSIISDNQRYKSIGNGWTVDVIAHIFKSLKNNSNSVEFEGIKNQNIIDYLSDI